MFCAASALGISWLHVNCPNLLVRSVFRFHVYFYAQVILHHLGIFLPHEDGGRRVKNSYIIKSAYYSIYDDYGVDADEIWMNGDLFRTKYSVFGDGKKITKWCTAYVFLVLIRS